MSKQSDIVKNLVKKNVGEKPTFGTDPRDPWSTKYNVTEDATLNKYLLSKGINPKYVTKDQKVAHSKMGQFIKWKRDHMGMAEQTTEPSPTLARLKELNKSKKHQTPIVKGVAEEVDKKDTVTFDIPLLIRVLELAREDVKTDMDLHRVVERLINMRNKGMLTMDDYDEIAAIKEEVFGSTPLEYIKEALNQLKEEFKKGDRVKHKDGTLGTVTREPDEHGIVSWKHAGNKHRVSHKSVLKSAAGEKFRWRKYDEEVEQVDEVRRGGFTAGWRDEKYFGKGVPTNRPMTDKEKAESDKTKDIQNYLNNLSKNRLKKEEVEQTDESYFGPRGDKLLARSHSAYDTGDKETGKRAHTLAMKAGEKYRSNPINRAKATREIMAGASADYNTGKRWTGDSVEYPEDTNVVSEISDTTLNSYKEKAKKSADTLHAQGQYKKSANRWLNVMKATGKQMSKMKFENTLDPKAATEAPCSCGNNPDDVEPQDKNKKLIQMSKSARIIKSIYKKKNMKEETYDHEKEDKSVATYGKKPKLSDNEKKMEQVGGQPKAAAVMSGGTTLTGTPRDTVEIDPMMKLKPGLIGQTKNNNR